MLSKRSIRLLVAVFALLLVAMPALAGRGDDADRASKNGMTKGKIDDVEVTLEYGRPNVKGRTIWGGLVPYGKVWRTGADEATIITFSCDAQIGDMVLEAGTYSLFTVPGEKSWEFILNRVTDQWGAYSYDAKQDAVRVSVTPQASEHVESMEFAIEGSQVVLRWEKLAVGFDVKAGC